MLSDIVTISRHHAEAAGVRAQPAHHLRGGVRDIDVSWPAEVRQAACNGEPARIVFLQANLSAADFDGGRKAAIKIEERHIVERPAGHVQSLSRSATNCRRSVQIDPL